MARTANPLISKTHRHFLSQILVEKQESRQKGIQHNGGGFKVQILNINLWNKNRPSKISHTQESNTVHK